MIPAAQPRRVTTVLAVEDDRAVAQAVALVLRGPGCHVITAHSGEGALAIIDRGADAIDVVLTDNNMPLVNGTELARRLRSRNYRGRIIVLSAHVSPEEKADYQRSGVESFVTKPFGMSELRSAVGV